MQVLSNIRTQAGKPALSAGKSWIDTRAAFKSGAFELMGASMTFKRNAEIYGEDEPSEYLYKLVSGAVRTYKVLADGRRQIGAFYLPGDIFGLEAGDEHAFSAE